MPGRAVERPRSRASATVAAIRATMGAAVAAAAIVAAAAGAVSAAASAAVVAERTAGAGAGGGGAMKLECKAFAQGATIPVKHTCDGPDLSPALAWSGAPAGTKTFALIVDDPDAPVGNWVHWVVYDLPAAAASLPEGVPKEKDLKGGGRQGVNDFRKIGYGGPCPPPGRPHRYFFRLYAFDRPLDLPAGATKSAVLDAANGHVLAEAEHMGTYGR